MPRPCLSHAVPRYFTHAMSPPAIIRQCLSFVKFRVVAGNIRTASPTVLTDCYASDDKLRGTPHGSWKKPNAGRSPTCRLWTADANSHIPCDAHAALCLEKSLSERHGRGMAWARHGMCESNTAALCKSNGKTSSKPLAARHGRGTAWTRHGNDMVYVN
jgi:hypothetical protein